MGLKLTSDLLDSWTLVDEDVALMAKKSGVTRAGFAVLLKFFQQHARFPGGPSELPLGALDYIAAQISVPNSELGPYWGGRSIKYHRAEIRSHFGFREFTSADEARLAGWLGGWRSGYARRKFGRLLLLRLCCLGVVRRRLSRLGVLAGLLVPVGRCLNSAYVLMSSATWGLRVRRDWKPSSLTEQQVPCWRC